MAGEVSKPHAHLFRTVFGEKAEAAGLLRAHLPEAVSGELRWSSIQEQEARQEGRHEGRQEGELRGEVLTIEGFLGRDVPWTTIEAATGVDQATFGRLKQQLDAADDDTNHPN